MKTTEYLMKILNELNRSASFIADDEADKLADHILSSNQIFHSRSGKIRLNGQILCYENDALGP